MPKRNKTLPIVQLQVSNEGLHKFTTFLQGGLGLRTPHGNTLGSFLSSLPGFTPSYISDILQTIFLDGNPLDDLETPLTKAHSVVALSAAMPGLAGAIFRRNSLHAALRGHSHRVPSTETSSETIVVTVKLFNAVAAERGPQLLQHGGEIKCSRLATFLEARPALLSSIQKATKDEEVIEIDSLLTFLQKDQDIFITMKEQNGDTK